MEYTINVAKVENEEKFVMYLMCEEGEIAEMEISKEYYEASLKEFNK